MNATADGLARRAISSIAATKEEREDLQDAIGRLGEASTRDQRLEQEEYILELSRKIIDRERGVDGQLPGSSAILASLTGLAVELQNEIARQQISARKGQRALLTGAIITAALAAAVGVAGAAHLWRSAEVTVTQVGASSLGVVAPLVVTVILMRLYQSRDAVLRHLYDKSVSLRFLRLSIVLAETHPDARFILDHAHEIFSGSSQPETPPITMRDLWPVNSAT